MSLSPITAAKKFWAFLPPDIQLFVHGAGSAAVGGAFAAAVIYFADHSHHNLAAIKESWPFIVAGASGTVLLYFKSSPLPGWKWDKAVRSGEAVERRASVPVPTPTVLIVPETPPGNPVPPTFPPPTPPNAPIT